MVPWCLLLALVAAASATEKPETDQKKTRVAKSADPDPAGSEFFPQFGFPSFPVHSQAVLPPPHDLTALQQTHVLGDFQHRFQHQRFTPPQFQNQPLLFSQQTEFGQPANFNPQRSPQQVLSPPSQAFPQQQNQFRPFPPAPPPPPQPQPKAPFFPPQQQFNNERPAFPEQRPQFPEPPRDSSPNFVDQPSRYQNSQGSFRDSSFRQTQDFRQPQPPTPPQQTFGNQPNQNIPLQPFQDQTIRSPSPNYFDNNQRFPQNNQFLNSRPNNAFEEPLRRPVDSSLQQPVRQPLGNSFEQPIRNNVQTPFEQQVRNPQEQNVRAPIQTFDQNRAPLQSNFEPSFRNQGFSSQPNNNQASQDVYNVANSGSQQISQGGNRYRSQENFDVGPPRPESVVPQAPQPQQNIYQDQFSNNARFPPQQRPTYQQDLDYQAPVGNKNNQIQDVFQSNKGNEPPVSFNPNRKPAFLPTQVPKTSGEDSSSFNGINSNHKQVAESEPPKRPLLPLIPADNPIYNDPSFSQKGVTLPKSQDPDFFQKSIEFESQPSINEIPRAPIPEAVASTPFPVKVPTYTKPAPEVKEITINLGTTPSPSESQGKGKSGRKEKTQEEIINEQIQKLLQSHNLEVVGKDQKEDSNDLPIPELPPHLKDKYQIKLVNSEILSEIKGGKKKKEKPATTAAPLPPVLPPLPDLPDHIKKQYDIKLIQKDELFKQFKIGTGGKVVTSSDLVSPLPGNVGAGNESTQVFLANGQQLQIVQFPKADAVKDSVARATSATTTTTTTTSKPPNELFEELAKKAIPPGADFELIKQNANGEIEKVKDLTAAKKVTFVLLEEQPDGTVKVQGVKGNISPEKTEKESVDSLIKKIKDGSLKLPPSQSILTNEIPHQTTRTFVTVSPFTEKETEATTFTYRQTTFAPTIIPSETAAPFTTTVANDLPETTFASTLSSLYTKKAKSKSRPSFLSTPSYYETSRRQKTSKRPSRRRPTTTTTTAAYEYDDDYNQRSSNYNGEGHQDVIGQESSPQPSPSLTKILQTHGLREMAKFLDQSGLDTILNETGPYTIFIPTDAAFANLQEQLGGMDRAEDKFRENPRLLSGLLLHHVVPGSFKLTDLQDEMTGVSLAGTQLRVNAYHSEKKDPLVTINGAIVSPTKHDIPVPQGVAHAVDRVLFPLPVGDLIQTLKGDRERRFNKFVKSIEASGLESMLTGSKTYTLFAPTDKAFSALTDAELDKLLTRREAARTIVLRHIMPGTLYSAGMHFFQVKESMERGQKITIQKELGKVKANSAQVLSTNIPATNGVVHVIETLL